MIHFVVVAMGAEGGARRNGGMMGVDLDGYGVATGKYSTKFGVDRLRVLLRARAQSNQLSRRIEGPAAITRSYRQATRDDISLIIFSSPDSIDRRQRWR